MDETRRIIRIELDGRWSADELGRTLLCLSELYDLRLFLEILNEDQRDIERVFPELMDFLPPRHRWRRRLFRSGPYSWAFLVAGAVPPALDTTQLQRLPDFFEPDERLEVRRVSYASPGSLDLAGIGAVVEHVKDFVLKLIERRDNKRQRTLSEERASLENDRLRIENARRFVALGKDLGYSDAELRRLVAHVDERQEVLARLVDQQKLRSISGPDSEQVG
jgi:hypothetical protein